jgi:hypothetical protein
MFVLRKQLVDISCAMKLENVPPYEKRPVEMSKPELDAIIDALELVAVLRGIIK